MTRHLSDDEFAAALDAAREEVAAAIGGLSGRHDPALLLHGLAYMVGGLAAVRVCMLRTPLEVELGAIFQTVKHGAACELGRRKLAALPPAGRA